MRAREFTLLRENTNLNNLKATLIHKISNLPPDEQTQHLLDEIEDILAKIPLGGRKSTLAADFGDPEKWTDTDVQKAKSLLATYVASLNANVQQKTAMVEKWRSSGLIDVSTLTDKEPHTIDQIVIDYAANPAVKELADDLLPLESLGRGKGEFMLCVLSPQIANAGKSGGDIRINQDRVEVKTFARGGFRFYDRTIKPGDNYRSLTNQFLKTYAPYLVQSQDQTSDQKNPQTTIPNHLNITKLGVIYKNLTDPKWQNQFSGDLKAILLELFPEQDLDPIHSAILNGQTLIANRLYAAAAYNHYRSLKSDKGMLFIDLRGTPQFLYAESADDLTRAGYALKISTVSPVSKIEQYAYPQTELIKV